MATELIHENTDIVEEIAYQDIEENSWFKADYEYVPDGTLFNAAYDDRVISVESGGIVYSYSVDGGTIFRNFRQVKVALHIS